MITVDLITIRRGPGRRPLLVRRIRRDCRRTRRTARRMWAAGRPASWIAAALRLPSKRVEQLLAADPIWGTARKAGE